MNNQIFISYSSYDLNFVNKLVEYIENNNFNCWYAYRNINPGTNWRSHIARAISESDVVLLILSNNSIKSEDISRELSLAKTCKKQVIPFKIDNVIPPFGVIAYSLALEQYIDYYQLKDMSCKILLDTIKNNVNKDIINEELNMDVNITKNNDFKLYITSDPETILASGDNAIITAQLYNKDKIAAIDGIIVTFNIDDDRFAEIIGSNIVKTDKYGRAIVTIKSSVYPKKVNINARLVIQDIVITSGTSINIVNWGTIIGRIYDSNCQGIPGAMVTLYLTEYDQDRIQYVRTKELKIPENPQNANDGTTSAVGLYCFERVPQGIYLINAQSEGKYSSSLANVIQGTVTSDVLIPGYTYSKPVLIKK